MEGLDGEDAAEIIALLKVIQEQGAWNLSLISLTIGMRSQRFFLEDIPRTDGDLLVLVPGRTLHRQWPVH